MNFIVHSNEPMPVTSQEDNKKDLKEAWDKVKSGEATGGHRIIYMREVMKAVETGEVTAEEIGLTESDMLKIKCSLDDEKRKRKVLQNIDLLKQDINKEQRKMGIFRDKKMLREKASEIKKIIEDNSLSYEECYIDPALISELIK